MREDFYATRQLHYHLHYYLRYSPFRGKDSSNAASLHHRYAPMTDAFAAAQHPENL